MDRSQFKGQANFFFSVFLLYATLPSSRQSDAYPSTMRGETTHHLPQTSLNANAPSKAALDGEKQTSVVQQKEIMTRVVFFFKQEHPDVSGFKQG